MSDVSGSLSRGGGGASIRACQNCSRAKAKCVPQANAGSDSRCTRCLRLDRECAVIPRAKRKSRAPNAATNTAKLEQKIESLVNILATAQGVNLDQLTPPESQFQSEASPVSQSQLPNGIPASSGPASQWRGGFLEQYPAASGDLTTIRAAEFPPPAPLPSEYSVPKFTKQHFSSKIWQFSDQDGQRVYRKFREEFMPHFPFVVISSDFQELKIQKPYTLKAAWTIAFQEGRVQQIEMCKDLMVDISTSMLLRGERDMDMLQCLILLNAWSYFVSPVPPSTKSTGLFQLAVGLLYDLKLTRPIRDYDGPGDILAEYQTRNVPDSLSNDTGRRSSDECRALLCVFYLGSVFSMCVKRTEGMPYMPYIDFCSQTLEDRAENEMDLLLIALVRLECIIRPIDDLLSKKCFTDDHRAPVTMYINSVRSNLENFWNTLPQNFKQHPLLSLSYNSHSIFLYEPALYKTLFTPDSYTYNPSQRLDLLHRGVLACKKLLDEYLSQPIWSSGICVADLAPLGRAISTLLKICMIEEPGWDLTIVRQTGNVSFYFEQLLSRYQQIGAILDEKQREPCRHSFLTGCARAMGIVKSWYETKCLRVPPETTQHDQAGTGMGFDAMMMEQPNFLDDADWMEFMGDWPLRQ